MMIFGMARIMQGIIISGWKVIIGMAVDMMVRISSGKVEIGVINDQTDLPALSSTFWRTFLVSGDSAVITGSRLIFLEIEI